MPMHNYFNRGKCHSETFLLKTMTFTPFNLRPGIVTGNDIEKTFNHARLNGYAIPSFNYTNSKRCHSILEAARIESSPVIIRVTYASCVSSCGKLAIDRNMTDVAVAEAVSLALRVRIMAKYYKVPVILQSETRCQHRLVTWYDGLIAANKAYFSQFGESLYSSHLLDLTTETNDNKDILSIGSKYMEEVDPLQIWLQLKLAQSDNHEDGWLELQDAYNTASKASLRCSFVLDYLPNYAESNKKTSQIPVTLDKVQTFSIVNDNKSISELTSHLNMDVVQVNYNNDDLSYLMFGNDNTLRNDKKEDNEKHEVRRKMQEADVVELCCKIMERLHSKDQYRHPPANPRDQSDPFTFWDFVEATPALTSVE